MKWYYRFFVVAILAAALIGPFFIKSPDGKPVMEMPTAQDFIPEQLFSGGSNSNTGSPLSSDGPSYYKWQDEQDHQLIQAKFLPCRSIQIPISSRA
jgi:hypothetical protein